MISLDLAKRLKEAGLEWEPKAHDKFNDGTTLSVWYVHQGKVIVKMAALRDGRDWEGDVYTETINPDRCIWLPRLDQLLAEIERRGWDWELLSYQGKNATKTVYIAFLKPKNENKYMHRSYMCSTPEDAAAQALIWILEREREDD